MKHRIYVFLGSVLLLSGCAHYEWQKYGATPNDLNRDKYICQREAAQVYPAKIVTREIRPGYTTPSTTNCSSTGSSYDNHGHTRSNSNVNCVTTPSQYVPAVSSTTDVNARNRENMANQCMNARGWQLVEVK